MFHVYFALACYPVYVCFQQQGDRDIASIVEMGFAVEQATSALQSANGNVQMALNSLLKDGNAAGPSQLTNGRCDSGHGRDTAKSRSNNPPSDGRDTRSSKGDSSSHGGGRSDGSQHERSG